MDFRTFSSLPKETLDSILPSLQLFTAISLFCVSMKVKVAQLCLTLCSTMDCSPPGSSVYGISQARILEWVAISFSRESSWPRDQTQVSCIAGRLFTLWAINHPKTFPSSWSMEKLSSMKPVPGVIKSGDHWHRGLRMKHASGEEQDFSPTKCLDQFSPFHSNLLIVFRNMMDIIWLKDKKKI